MTGKTLARSLTDAERETIALFASNRYNAVALTEHIVTLKLMQSPRPRRPGVESPQGSNEP